MTTGTYADKRRKKYPPSSSLDTAPAPTPTGYADLDWINSVNHAWGKHVFKRMDSDEKLWTQEPYELRDAKGDLLEDVINVTMNDARVFGERVLAVQNETEEVIEINGFRNGKELDGHQTGMIENWWHDLMYVANERLSDIMMPPVDAYSWEQIDIRGRVAARILLSQERDYFEADIMPIDTRQLVFAVGRSGLSKVAFWDDLSKDECEEEYPDYQWQGDNASTVRRWDFWDNTREMVFLGNNLYGVWPNFCGRPPFAIELCQQGTYLKTSDRALRMHGESLFSANRELYPELNRIASIMQTQNMLTLAPPQVLKSVSGRKLPSEPLYRLGRILALETTEGLQKIDAPDIQASTRFFQALLGGALQRGSISHIDWGNLQFQLSQVAIATLAGASRQVFTPRNNTMARFKHKMFKEARRQFELFNLEAKIGRAGKASTYTAKDLEGEYTTDFEYITALPEETAAAYGLADMAQRWMDDRSIRKNILKYKDYDDVDEKFTVQQAKRTSRALAFFDMAQKMEKQGLKQEAKLLLAEAGLALEGKTGDEVMRVSGTPAPGDRSLTRSLGTGTGQPGEVMRTTRKNEPPGAGELEKETVNAEVA